jgi:hypothetical protein
MFEFKDPPSNKGKTRSAHWVNVVKELNENPDQWALTGSYSVGVSTHIKDGRYPAFFPLGCADPIGYVSDNYEITTRRDPDAENRVLLFIRKKP